MASELIRGGEGGEGLESAGCLVQGLRLFSAPGLSGFWICRIRARRVLECEGFVTSISFDKVRANFMLRKLRCCSRVWELS